MSHEFVQGFFSNNEPAWHGLGYVFPEGVWPGREEGMRLAGHDFQVIERPMAYAADTPEEFEQAGGMWVPTKGSKMLLNGTTFEPLSIQGEGYEVVQNDVPWTMLEDIAKDASGNVKWHCGLKLREGRVLVVVAYVDEPWFAPGDDSRTFPFISAAWSHDGSSAIKFIRSSIREVCMNTKIAAEDEARRTGLEFTFKHTKNVAARLDAAKEVLRGSYEAFNEYKAMVEELATLKIDKGQRELFLTKFIPEPVGVEISDRVVKNIEDARDAVRSLLLGKNGTVTPAMSENGYGLYSAGLEYLQQVRRYKSKQSRLGRSLLREDVMTARLASLVKASAAA